MPCQAVKYPEHEWNYYHPLGLACEGENVENFVRDALDIKIGKKKMEQISTWRPNARVIWVCVRDTSSIPTLAANITKAISWQGWNNEIQATIFSRGRADIGRRGLVGQLAIRVSRRDVVTKRKCLQSQEYVRHIDVNIAQTSTQSKSWVCCAVLEKVCFGADFDSLSCFFGASAISESSRRNDTSSSGFDFIWKQSEI